MVTRCTITIVQKKIQEHLNNQNLLSKEISLDLPNTHIHLESDLVFQETSHQGTRSYLERERTT